MESIDLVPMKVYLQRTPCLLWKKIVIDSRLKFLVLIQIFVGVVFTRGNLHCSLSYLQLYNSSCMFLAVSVYDTDLLSLTVGLDLCHSFSILKSSFMAATKCRRWVLKTRSEGIPKLSDFDIVEEELSPLKDGGLELCYTPSPAGEPR